MTVHAIKAPAGLGKTTLVLDKLQSSAHERVEIYVPTLELANEIQGKLAAVAVRSRVLKGRDQPDGPGQTMCRKPDLAREISKLGYPVFPVICMGQKTPGDPYSRASCEHFRDCAYLKQFEADERVLIYTHAYLPLPRNNKETIRPSLVVIDESFLSTCLETYVFPRGGLRKAVQGNAKKTARTVVNLILKAFDEDQPLLDTLRNCDLPAKTLDLAYKEVYSSGTGFNTFDSDDKFLAHLKTVPSRMRVDVLIEVLIAELKTPRSDSHGITFDHKAQVLSVHYRKPITRFRHPTAEPEIVLIDANADLELVRPWFPDAKFHEISAARNAYVIQCDSMRGSTSSFVPDKHTNADSKKWAENNLDGLQKLIDRESEDGTKKKLLIVGPQAVAGNSRKKLDPLIRCPPNAALAHFNGLRGVDAYKDCDSVIVIGRNQPPIASLEDLARALWFDSAEALTFADDWVLEMRPYRMRDPAQTMGVEVLVHPDPRIQKLHEQIREGESTQAIDRLRLVHAVQPKRVILVSNIPLDIEVDELLSFKELAWQTRLERALAELGVLSLNPEFLSGRFPHLWPTPAAAKMDLRGEDKKDQTFNSNTIRNSTLFTYEYRVGGQRRSSRALSPFPLDITHNELSLLLERPIITRSTIDRSKAGIISGSMGSPKLLPMSAYGAATSG